MLKKAKNKMAYAKVGIYGDAGAGKTVTASKLAIGLHKQINSQKPIVFFDTEPAASFVAPLFESAGIDLLVADESRALVDLMAFMDEAEQVADIAIIDSISHVWRDAQESYIQKMNDIRRSKAQKNNWQFRPINQIEFQDWRHIKGEWARFTDRYLSSKLHVFVLGRAGTIYEYQDNDRTGKKELISTGTKMATEKELGYEPSLLIEMSKVAGKDTGLINRAFVEKDRNVADPLTGWRFDYPTFENFKKHFDFYDIGGEHFNSMDARDSRDMYSESGEDSFTYERKQREIACEELKALFVKYDLDGTAKDVKQRRLALLEQFYSTGSWTKIENTDSSKIIDANLRLEMHLKNQGFDEAANN